MTNVQKPAVSPWSLVICVFAASGFALRAFLEAAESISTPSKSRTREGNPGPADRSASAPKEASTNNLVGRFCNPSYQVFAG
jgi:hypothetical protein